MNCLNCLKPLLHVKETHFLRSISYDVCENCSGLWLRRGILDKLAYQTPGSVEAMSLMNTKMWEKKGVQQEFLKHQMQSSHKCLDCKHVHLVKMPFMGKISILMDRCPNCGGHWLYGGELEEINRAIKETDKKAKPSKFDHFLKHIRNTYWHQVEVG